MAEPASKWGFLRETREKATGIDKDTGLGRTGLDDYLAVIFPQTSDWVHDKAIGILPSGKKSRRRPDYRSDSLGLIVEFDGVQHYSGPIGIRRDEEAKSFYEELGYKVVRIPFFIQLTNTAVLTLFGVEVEEHLFDGNIPSLGPKGVTPAQLPLVGVLRMAREFMLFPEQYEVNLKRLKEENDEMITGAKLLECAYQAVSAKGGEAGCLLDLAQYYAQSSNSPVESPKG